MCNCRDRAENENGVPQTEVTPEMIDAGAARHSDLIEAGVGSAYLVEEVYRAMCSAREAKGQQGN